MAPPPTRPAVADALRDLLAVVNSSRGLDEILQYVVAQAVNLLGGQAGATYLRDGESFDSPDGLLSVRASLGLRSDQLAVKVRMGTPVSGLAARVQRPVVCCDLATALADDLVLARQSEIAERASHLRVVRMGPALDPDLDARGQPRVRRLLDQFRAVLAVPLVSRTRGYGVISLYYSEPRDFSEEEIGLALAFGHQAALAIENAYLHAAAERRLGDLRALYSADEVLHQSLQIDDVLGALVDVATDVLGADKTSVLIWDDTHERLVPGATRGFLPESVARMSHLLGEGITGRVAQTGQPIAVPDALADPRVAHAITDPENIRSLLHVPIKVGGEVFGVFGINYCQPRSFTGRERRLLEALAQRAGLAIQNAQLYERAQQAAALEERQRLARELHDAVTQTLFSASLIAEVTPRLWERDPQEGTRRLHELRRLTRGALAEMRTLLVELRPGGLVELPLGHLLLQLADATSSRAALEIDVQVDGDQPLPPDVQVGLYRIAQEALNNVVKHAQARQVRLSLSSDADALDLIVRDDGAGFDPDNTPAGHFGLRIMRERAEAIGAHLDVSSSLGGGTRVNVRWPARKAPSSERD